MIVKVCGVRTVEVAEVALDAGAGWLGLVLEPRSPRHVEDSAARAIAAAVGRRADLVGVMVEPSVADCDAAAERYGLAAVQVHGDVDSAIAAWCSVPVIRALNIDVAARAYRDEWWPGCMVLIDAAPRGPGELPGGTGERIDRDAARALATHRDVILAGGLNPENVAAAIGSIRPRGVDASSGLESAPGVKDPARVRAYVRAAREAFSSLATEVVA
jgi:phosphoribosylanthranilate isomerase